MIDLTKITIPTTLAADILNKWADAEKITLASISKQSGYTYDVIHNVFSAKNKDVSLERAGRISYILGHSLEEFCELAFNHDEEILCSLFPSRQIVKELEEKLRQIEEQNLSISPNSSQNEVQALVQTQVYAEKTTQIVEKVEGIPQATHLMHGDTNLGVLEEFMKVRNHYGEKLEGRYQLQIEELHESLKELKTQYEQKYEDRKQLYERMIASQRETIRSQRRRLVWVTSALVFETLLYAGQWIYDALNPHTGFLTGYLEHLFNSKEFFNLFG